MLMTDRIRQKLQAAFDPVVLEVRDDSADHIGHAGARPEGETHFSIRIGAPAFAPMTRIAQHRAIHAALGADIISEIHALAITVVPLAE